MNYRNFSGAKWWKFDFHAHTPASMDVDQNVSPESWLTRYMKEEIDCVAITDHNCGDWIDILKDALEEMKETQHPDYRPLALFPGVEITATNNTHILAIFGPDKNSRYIENLIGAVEYGGSPGKSDGVTNKSIPDVAKFVAQRGGIAIPAHVDRTNGLFETTRGNTLNPVLISQDIIAMEVVDDNYTPPPSYAIHKKQWTKIRGSDTHFVQSDRFGTFTWTKMDEPTIEGLKLALTDGVVSVNCDMNADPNKHAEWVVEELVVENAKFMGRSTPLLCQFSPFLNAIIGSRGSGKSTLLEFMRLILCRKDELSDQMLQENKRYFSTGADSLLISDSKLHMICRKGDSQYRISWSPGNGLPSLEQKRNEEWELSPGEIKTLFPARIYSQKQIFELSSQPLALLRIIDEPPIVQRSQFDNQRAGLENRYVQIDQQLQEIDRRLDQENRLLGQRDDTARQIRQIEESGHAEVLQLYRTRQQQKDETERLETEWDSMTNEIKSLATSLTLPSIKDDLFERHPEILTHLNSTNQEWVELKDSLNSLALKATKIVKDWHKEKETADWMALLENDRNQYEQLKSSLLEQDIDPEQYPSLLSRLQSVHDQLQTMDELRTDRSNLITEKQDILNELTQARNELTSNRQEFIRSVPTPDSSINIRIVPFGEDWDTVEKSIREIIQSESSYVRDFAYLEEIYNADEGNNFEKLKDRIVQIRSGTQMPRDQRFRQRLDRLPQESMSSLDLWFPEDGLEISFGPHNRPIEQGSPGQKTAAILAFILSYGSEPLLLDQPEDDLDNELTYELVVQQLRNIKTSRQIIVVTHNANIVVNGDAEMVLPLKIAAGESHVQQQASLQRRNIRQWICNVLEGGQRAFEQRYRRINLE